MKSRLFLILLVVLLLIAARTSIYFVDQAEYVYLTQFGRPVATFDGARDAGLHFKLPWPVQSVTRLDRRLQAFDVPTQELLVRSGRKRPRTRCPLPSTSSSARASAHQRPR